jgi:hypothetical protein
MNVVTKPNNTQIETQVGLDFKKRVDPMQQELSGAGYLGTMTGSIIGPGVPRLPSLANAVMDIRSMST